MDIKEIQKRIDEMESEFAKELIKFTDETGCVIEDLFIKDISTQTVADKRKTVFGYSVRIRTYL